MRLLIVDGNLLLVWMIEHLTPDDVEVASAGTPEQARAAFRDCPPDAVVVNVRRMAGPWREVAGWCFDRRPPIPVLFHGGARTELAEAGIVAGDRCLVGESLCARDLDRLISAAEKRSAGV